MTLENCITKQNKYKESLLSQSELKRLLHYNPETGVFTRLVKTAHRIKIGDIAGCKDKGYLRIRINGNLYLAHRLAFLYITGAWPENEVDHDDRIRDNNKWDNLKDSTVQYNNKNHKIRSDNKSGFNGVYWDKNCKRWRSQIAVDGEIKRLGCFIRKSDAIDARKQADIDCGYHPNHGK